jgi:hypothetical protein
MLILESLTAGICAYVVFAILMQPGMILGFYGDLVVKWYNEWPRKWAWIAKPLGYCGTCFSGQFGFWWFVIRYSPTDFFALVVFTLQTIFFFTLISNIKDKLNGSK